MFCIFLHFCNERIDRIMKSFIFFSVHSSGVVSENDKKKLGKIMGRPTAADFPHTHTQRTAQQLAVTTCYAHLCIIL